MTFDATLFFGGLAIASFVGFLTGVFGVGGGFLITPVLMIFLDVSAPIAIGTGLTMILVTSTFGIVKRRGSGTLDMKLAVVLGVSCIGGTLIGVQVVELLKDVQPLVINGRKHVAVQYIALCAFLVLLAGLSVVMLVDYRLSGGKSPPKRVGLFAKVAFGPCVHFSSLEEPKVSLVLTVLLGLVIGVLKGWLGIGGGVVLLPALVYLVGQRTAKAAGTSLAVIWVSAASAASGHIVEGNIDLVLLAGMLIGGLTGVNFGTKLGLRTAGPKLRLYFLLVLAAAVAIIAYEMIRITFFEQLVG